MKTNNYAIIVEKAVAYMQANLSRALKVDEVAQLWAWWRKTLGIFDEDTVCLARGLLFKTDIFLRRTFEIVPCWSVIRRYRWGVIRCVVSCPVCDMW